MRIFGRLNRTKEHRRSALVLSTALLMAFAGFLLWSISPQQLAEWQSQWAFLNDNRLRLWGLLLLGTAALVCLIGCLTVFPASFIYEDYKLAVDPVDAAKLVEARNSIRSTLVNALAGILLIFGAIFTWQQLVTTREGQLSDQFTSAAGLLDATDSGARMSAAAALGELAHASPSNDRVIYSVLANYVRTNASKKEANRTSCERLFPGYGSLARCAPDVQAALSALGNRPSVLSDGRPHIPNLAGVNLRGALLGHARMTRTDLRGAILDDMDARTADAPYVDLERADLRQASMLRAQLGRASLKGASLEGANLSSARLDSADLTGATYDRETDFPDGFDPDAEGLIYRTP